MRVSYSVNRGEERWYWSGESDGILLSGDEFEVTIYEDGIRVYPKHRNTITPPPIFVLPLPLPKP